MNCLTIALVLSIAFLSPIARAQDSTSRNASAQDDSAKAVQGDFERLVQTLMSSGRDSTIKDGFAQIIGLANPMATKVSSSWISRHGKDEDIRSCQVVYEPDENGGKHPACVYLERTRKSLHDHSSQYFRVNLGGQLEKVITLRGKYDDDGNSIRDARSNVDEDIDSPEIKEAFRVELTYWLKDWLKKQKSPAAAVTQ